MKRFLSLILAIIITAALFSSCKKNEDAKQAQAAPQSSSVSEEQVDEKTKYLNWTYSDWNAASEEERSSCTRVYLERLYELQGYTEPLSEEELMANMAWEENMLSAIFMLDTTATLDQIITNTLSQLTGQ